MSDSIALGTLKTKILRQADAETSDFIDSTDYAADPTKAELTYMVQDSIKKFYDMMVKSFEDYFLKEDTITTVASQKDYDLPTDFYKFLGLDYEESSGSIYPCRQFLFREREQYTNHRASGNGRHIRYRLLGSKIRLLPIPLSVMTFTLSYIPTPTIPEDDADTFDFVQGWDNWVMWDCVVKCLIKGEDDIKEAVGERDRTEARIRDLMTNRDANEPQRVLNKYDLISGYGIDSSVPPRED